ncbi:hypothetical protein ACI2KX_15755 [Ectopseudomonas khazarica]|uniref:hypothetical protein n=1 Tax=Ectopseudomonas khazarica TaxID=2502979 RepID=UPI00384BC516
MSEIKERPILFSGPMVRAILEGRKTVTRREIKPTMHSADLQFDLQQEADGGWHPYHTFDESRFDRNGTEHPIKCPYGQPSERLWVRESTEADYDTHDAVTLARYCADKAPVLVTGCADPAFNGSVAHWNYPRDVRPSIHMKREQARILLEITAVRVERLQDISGDQAEAEGVDAAMCRQFLETSPSRHECKEAVIHGFSGLWASINGSDNWAANPWVWVVEFKRVTP